MGRLIALLIALPLAACAAPRSDDPGRAPAPVASTSTVTMPDGTSLPLARWLPPGPPCRVVLAAHGFNDFHQAFAELAQTLSRDCVAVYAWDQRGFGANPGRGLWPGSEQLVSDAISMARIVQRRHPGVPLYLAGESMGAAVMMLALARQGLPPVAGVVLLAPAVWGREVQPWYMRAALWLGVRLLPGMTVSRDWVGLTPSDDPAVLYYWDTHPLVVRKTRIQALYGVTNLMDAALARAADLPAPALILYGGEDEIMPLEAFCALLARLPPAGEGYRIGFYPQGYHLLSRGSEARPVRRDIAAWLRAPDAPLPSGRAQTPAHARDRLCPGLLSP